jgi:phage/plasmid-like protein (TIGR03299 family)
MSKETMEWLNNNTLIGFTQSRGNAWHYRAADQGGESNHYPGAIPLADALRRIFHWHAVSGPVQTTIAMDDGTELSIEDSERQVIVRPDTGVVFGVFKSGYTIHQFDEWLIANASVLLDQSSSDLGIANVVSLRKGAVAAVQFEVPDTIATPEGVEFRPSLLAASSLDGTLATTYRRCITNVVCDNTLDMGLSEKSNTVKIKHSKYSSLKITDAREALALVYTIADDFAEMVAELCSTAVTGKQFYSFLDVINPIPEDEGRAKTMAEKKRDDLLTLWVNDPRVTPWQGTAYGVLQMANTYAAHVAPTNKGTVRVERNFFDAASGKLATADAATLETLDKVLANV